MRFVDDWVRSNGQFTRTTSRVSSTEVFFTTYLAVPHIKTTKDEKLSSLVGLEGNLVFACARSARRTDRHDYYVPNLVYKISEDGSSRHNHDDDDD